MGRLVATLLLVVAMLAALDRLAAVVTAPDTEMQSIDVERHEQFRHAIARQFDELRADVGRLAATGYARWDALPAQKRPRELRIVIVGNSSAMFALAPSIVGERLAAAFPTRDVTVTPLLLPGVQVIDEEILVQAAIAKHADVVVMTPNLSALIAGPSGISDPIRRFFRERPTRGVLLHPTQLVEDFLERHWLLYRDRELLRMHIVEALSRRLAWRADPDDDRSRRGASAAFTAISEAAARGDVHELVDTYNRHGMGTFLGGAFVRNRLHPLSPVFGTVTKIAKTVQQSGAIGIAVFMPVHPLFRNATATADFPDLRLDDGYVHDQATRILGIYRAAGFTTFDRVDALPASAFIDMIHVNADGMEAFSREMAATLTDAIRSALPPG